MAQRISRAKQTISGTGFDFSLPSGAERTERLRAVLRVLYLVFNEGYTASEGDALTVPALSRGGHQAHPLAAPAAAGGARWPACWR